MLLFLIGAIFSVLAAMSAWLIAYHEYRRHMLSPGQDPRRMALGTAFVTLVFMLTASAVLSYVLAPGGP